MPARPIMQVITQRPRPDTILRRFPSLLFSYTYNGEIVNSYTLVGTPTRNVEGAFPGSRGLNFDGTDDGQTIGQTGDPGTGALTIIFWVRTTNGNQNGTILGRRDTASPFTQWRAVVGSWDASLSSSSTKRMSLLMLGNPATERRTWTSDNDILDGNAHVVVWRRNGNTVSLEVDGSDRPVTNIYILGSGVPNVTGWTTDDAMVGNTVGAEWFAGQLDYVTYSTAVIDTWLTVMYARALNLYRR